MPEPTTLLIDADILVHRAAAAAEVATEWEPDQWTITGDARAAKQQVDSEVAELMDTLKADACILALSDRKANFRKELCPTYKAKRGRKPVVFAEVREYVQTVYKTMECPRLEADDVLGMLATGTKIKGTRIIVSTDKDLRSVPGWLYNPGRPDDGIQQITELDANHQHWMLTLCGDATDGYPGCPGIGPKRAARLLDEAPDGALYWDVVVAAFKKAGKTEEDALLQARLARVLRAGEYVKATGEVKLWKPS